MKILALAATVAVALRTVKSFRAQVSGVDEGLFRARPLLLFVFGGFSAFCLWPAIVGIPRDPSAKTPVRDDIILFDVLSRLIFFGIAAFFAAALFVCSRTFIRITPDEVEYFDGWRKRRRILRNDILSAEVRHPGAILVVECTAKEDKLTIPLIAYSRAGLLAGLLQRSAMRL